MKKIVIVMTHDEVRAMVRDSIRRWTKESAAAPPINFSDFSRRVADAIEITETSHSTRTTIYESDAAYSAWLDIEAELSQGCAAEKIDIWNTLVEHHVEDLLQECNVDTTSIELTPRRIIDRLKIRL